MARSTLTLQVFVGSPSDVVEERSVLDGVVQQLNQVWSKDLGVTLEVLKWETHVHPSFSSDPQAAINEQIGEQYDIFIGIFWGRVGTATPRHASGTMEEFELAFARFEKSGKSSPEIMIYFKDTPIHPSKMDVDQLKALDEFRSTISSRGGVYHLFDDPNSFEASLRSHLAAVVPKIASRLKGSESADMRQIVLPAASEEEDDDYGYLDYLEIYQGNQSELTSAISSINGAIERIGEQMTDRSRDLKESAGDPLAIRRQIKRAAEDMHLFAETMSSRLIVIAATRKAAFNALSNALAIRGDFDTDEAELVDLGSALASLITGIDSALGGAGTMRGAVNALPRVNKDLNKAKRAVLAQLDAFNSEIEDLKSTLVNIIDAIRQMLGH